MIVTMRPTASSSRRSLARIASREPTHAPGTAPTIRSTAKRHSIVPSTAWVIVAGRRYGGADGRSKKEAEQRAAEAAWRVLSDDSPGPVATAPGPPSPNGAKPAEAGTRAEADAVVDPAGDAE